MRVGDVYAVMTLDDSQFDAGLRKAQQKGNSFSGMMKNALSFTLGMGMFEAVRSGFKAIIGGAIDYNSQMEQAQIGFTTMLGSAEKASAFLDQVADFAAKTPFEFPELLDASKRMMAYGFAAQDVLPTMEAVGNASAALGLGTQGMDRIILALGQMRAKAKVSGEEMRQLTEAGIPAWEILAEAMGKSTAEVMNLSQRGLIPANQAIQMLTDGMNKRFPDMMKQMENTWIGVTSTIKDIWRMTIGALTSDLFQGLVGWLQGIRDWATEFYNTFRQFGLRAALTKMLGAEFASIVYTIIGVLKGFWNMMRAIASFMINAWSKIGGVVLGVLRVFIAFKIATVIIRAATWATAQFSFVLGALRGQSASVSGIFRILAAAVGTYRLQLHLASKAGVTSIGIFGKIRLALYSLYAALGPVGIALIIITAILSALMSLWGKYSKSVEEGNWKKINQSINASANSVKDSFAGMQNSFKGASDSSSDAIKDMNKLGKSTKKAAKEARGGLQPFDEINQLMSNMADAVGDAAGGLNMPSMGIPDIPGVSVPEVDIPEIGLEDLFAFDEATLSGFFQFLWEEVKKGFGKVWEWLVQYVLGLWETLKFIWGKIVEGAKTIWDGLKKGLSAIWKGIKTVAITTWESIKVGLSTIWKGIKTVGTTIWNALKTFFSNVWNSIKTVATTTWNGIKSFFSTVWNSIKSTSSTIFNNIKNAIVNAFNTVKTRVTSIWNSIKSFFSNLWNGIKTTASSIFNTIKNTIISVFNSVKTRVTSIWNSIWNGIKSVINSIIRGINSMIRGLNKLKFNFPSWVPYLGGKSFGINIRTIPYLARGGIVTSPTLAMIGEAGAEAVVPLERNTGWIDELARKVATAMQGVQTAGASTGSGDIYVYIGNEQVDAYIYRSQDRRNIRSNGR